MDSFVLKNSSSPSPPTLIPRKTVPDSFAAFPHSMSKFMTALWLLDAMPMVFPPAMSAAITREAA